jgi:hypothetical protein
MLDTSGRSLMVVVLDEELLMELALWWWVVFVLWATAAEIQLRGAADPS